VPTEQIDAECKKMLIGADWETARKIEAMGKVGQRMAAVLDMKDHVKVLKRSAVRAERRMGELLRDMEKARGGEQYHRTTGIQKGPVVPTYADLGITKKEAFRWQKIAEVNAKLFEEIVEVTPTIAALLKVAVPEASEPVTKVPLSVDDSVSAGLSIGTLRNLIKLVQELVISEKTVFLYLYYCINGDTCPTQQEIKTQTRLSFPTIKTHTKILEVIGGITRGKGSGRQMKVNVLDITPLPSSSYKKVQSILDIRSQKEDAHEYLSGGTLSSNKKRTRGGYSGFSVADILADEDWQTAKAPLEKHFKEFEIDPKPLTTKKRFTKLVELLYDETFNFPDYCRWYAQEKYEEKGFNYGLFLYPNVLEEYKDAYEQEGKYLRTSSNLQNSESFKKGVKETKKFIKELIAKDEEEQE
jgi:hypothetical protein